MNTTPIPQWNVAELNGYQPITTFWHDFSIADHFGTQAVKDTYRRAFAEWKDNYKYLTELVLVLNHKYWQHLRTNDTLSRLYGALYYTAKYYAEENLTDEEFKYYFNVTD